MSRMKPLEADNAHLVSKVKRSLFLLTNFAHIPSVCLAGFPMTSLSNGIPTLLGKEGNVNITTSCFSMVLLNDVSLVDLKDGCAWVMTL